MSNNKNKHNFQGKECFSRMNFLYQASMIMAGKNNTLAAYYGEMCRNIGKKAVLRIDPEVKRNLCKRCSLAQKPGITADLDEAINTAAESPTPPLPLRRKRRRKANKAMKNLDDNARMLLTCHLCGHQRNFVVNPNYKFWLENSSSIAEIATLEMKEKQSSSATNAVMPTVTNTKIKEAPILNVESLTVERKTA